MNKIYQTKEEILNKAKSILKKSLRNVLTPDYVFDLEKKINNYESKRKGLLGNVVEEYFFEIKPGNASEPDFKIPGVELKTTPLKRHSKSELASKERLVFSMINYNEIIKEDWKNSSFLKKNKCLLLMFYLWTQNQNILDYKFEFVHLLNLLEDISDEDTLQIQKDWEYIVAKIKRNEAHLLSEGDTYYLGASTKAANSKVVRDQATGHTSAKPRAFSFKQQYINYLIQTKLLGKKSNTDSIFKKVRRVESVEDATKELFAPFIGKTDRQILDFLNSNLKKNSKSYKRLIVNKILDSNSGHIEELEKGNITLKAITLEASGTLKESVSFSAFDYKDLVTQIWEDEEDNTMADLHLQLETKKFLFVVFQKQKNGKDIILKKILFWNFPMKDIEKAKNVWETTINLINEGKIVERIETQKNGKQVRFTHFPGSSFNGVIHVRPHGINSNDSSELPVDDILTNANKYTKHCFWINAEYIQQAIEKTGDQA